MKCIAGVLALLVLGGEARGQGLARRSVAVQVVPAGPEDVEIANQVLKISVDTMENYRNMATRRYLEDKDVNAQEELKKVVTEATRKVSTGMRSKTFDEGAEALDRAYVRVKELLGELEVELVASIYLGLSMVKAVLGDKGLAVEYMLVFRNLQPDRSRQSVAFSPLFTEVFDKAQARLEKTHKRRVTITVEPREALVGVDGRVWGKAPLELELTTGGHLVQVEAEGYYRAGWVKDPALDGDRWKLSLKEIESRGRYLQTVERLAAHYGPPRAKKEGKIQPLADADSALASLRALLKSDHLLFLCVWAEDSKIRLRGAFESSFGAYPIDTAVERDAKVIDSIRAILLEASDVDKHKERLALEEASKRRERLIAWGGELVAQLRADESTLMMRAKQWALVGEPKKAELFAATAAEVSVLAARGELAKRKIDTAPEEAVKEFAALSEDWKQLGEKVRSLLAWDIAGALRRRDLKEIHGLATLARSRLDELSRLLKQKKGALKQKERARVEKRVKQLTIWFEQVENLMRKDPLGFQARRLLFRILIRLAELDRRLKLLK